MAQELLQKRVHLNLKRQKVILGIVEKLLRYMSCCKQNQPINLLFLLNAFHMTLSNGTKETKKQLLKEEAASIGTNTE